MKVRKVPLRTCIITKEKLEKKDLIRIVRTPEGKVVVDTTGKLNGRGTYIKKDANVIQRASKNKIFDKYLEAPVDKEVYEELLNIIIK